MTEDICGEIKDDGEKCTFSPKHPDGKCGFHTDQTEDSKTSKLQEHSEIIELMGKEINRGATVSEALAEVEEKTGVLLPRGTHDNWMNKGKTGDEDSIYTKYRSTITRARTIDKRQDRGNLKETCKENGDTRTWLKIHELQYGDLYDGEGSTDDAGAPFAIPEELIEEWQQPHSR